MFFSLSSSRSIVARADFDFGELRSGGIRIKVAWHQPLSNNFMQGLPDVIINLVPGILHHLPSNLDSSVLNPSLLEWDNGYSL